MALFGNISRRNFFKTGAAGVVVAGAISIAAGCSHQEGSGDAGKPLVLDESSGTNVLDSYSSTEYAAQPSQTWTLPLGSVLHPADGNWIPVTTAGASATPMVKGSALSLTSGQVVDVVPTAQMNNTTAVIYDVRCSDSVYAWVEVDTTTFDWELLAAPFSDGKLTGDAKVLYKADKNWDPAPFACGDDKVVWLVQPSSSGEKTRESSHCYVWRVGDSEGTDAVESPGRFATAPSISKGVVTLTPRVRASEGTYYGVTAYLLGDNLKTKVDQLVMPQSVKPFTASRVDDKFIVSVEASYDSGGLLGKMGTYILPASGENPYIIEREPYAIAAGKGSLYIIKSRASYVLVDTQNQTANWLYSMDRSVDYGEFPAREGNCDSFVTYSTVKDPTSGYPASVTVRVFSL